MYAQTQLNWGPGKGLREFYLRKSTYLALFRGLIFSGVICLFECLIWCCSVLYITLLCSSKLLPVIIVLNFCSVKGYRATGVEVFMKMFQKSTFLLFLIEEMNTYNSCFLSNDFFCSWPKLSLVKDQRLCVITLLVRFLITCPEKLH